MLITRMTLALCLFSCLPLAADDQQPAATTPTPAVELNEQEQAFVKQLTNIVLVGRFSVQGREERTPSPERYTIQSVTKVADEKWIVTARITYGQYDLPVPVPVAVHWAGDTPMIQVTDLTIPGMGSGFSSRVLFYGDRYAGTWQHGKVGGHMWGTLEPVKSEESAPSEQK